MEYNPFSINQTSLTCAAATPESALAKAYKVCEAM